MSLQFISNSVLRGDASFSTGSAALFQSSGNNTTSDTWIYNSGSLANGYQLDFGHGIVRTATNIIMTLKDSNVGIGTTSPITKLQISATDATSPTANIFLDIDGSNQPGMGGQIIFGTSTSGTLTNYIARIQGVRSALDNGSSDIHFQTTHVATSIAPTTKMTILSAGNVGIGTNSPSYKLHVKDTVDGNVNIAVENASTGTNAYASYRFKNNSISTAVMFLNGSNNTGYAGASSLNMYQGTSLPLGFVTNNLLRMTVNGGGNVGIGVADPQAKLEVMGISNTPADGKEIISVTNTSGSSKLLLGVLENNYGWIQSAEGSTLRNLSLNPNGGNVGIGENSPSFKLEVNSGTTNVTSVFKSTDNQAWISVQDDDSGTYGALIGTDSDESENFVVANTSAAKMLSLTSTGSFKLHNYDSTNKTGTPTYILGTDASGNVVKVLGGDIPAPTGTVTGTGTAEYIPKWNSTTALVNSKMFQSTVSSQAFLNVGTGSARMGLLVVPENTNTITGYEFGLQLNNNSTFNVGGQSKTYTSIYEGIKILPGTDHYLTRITPRLEVYPFEDPSTTTDNTYGTGFVGSCFSMGSQNVIGDASSSNLGIFGFNNTITGDKFVIIGQGNTMGKANVSSLVVGTTNANSGNGKLVNSLLVGQNMTLTQSATRSIVGGINHSFQGAMNNTVIIGSGNQGFGSNNFIWGSSNQGSGVNNIMLGGFSGQITQSSGNLYGTALMGWNNTVQNGPRASFVTGRDNIIDDTDYSISGGFNNDTLSNHSSLLVGTKNFARGVGNITGGEENEHASVGNNYNLMVGFKNKLYSTGSSNLFAGSTNEIGSSNNLVVGQNNKVQISTKNNIVGGNTNIVYSTTNENNILSGLRNNIFVGSNNTVSGLQNDIGITGNANSKVSHSIVIGSNNNVGNQAAGTIANKSNMAVFGSTNNVRGNNTFVAGSNNSAYVDNAIILGNGNSGGGVSSGDSKVIQIGFSIQPNSQSNYIAIGYGITALPTTANDGSGQANKYTAVGRHPDDNTDYDLSSLDPVSFIVGAGSQQNYKRTAIAVTCKSGSGTNDESNVILPGVGKYRNYTNDTTAAAGGVPIYGLYHTSGTIKIRLT